MWVWLCWQTQNMGVGNKAEQPLHVSVSAVPCLGLPILTSPGSSDPAIPRDSPSSFRRNPSPLPLQEDQRVPRADVLYVLHLRAISGLWPVCGQLRNPQALGGSHVSSPGLIFGAEKEINKAEPE